MASPTLRVLIVDDSAVVRQILSSLLTEAGDMVVSTAGDPYIAQRKMEQERPDVIVLDLELPRMDGLTFLRRLMRDPAPVPVVVCSGHVGQGSETALRALDEGAVEVLARPKIGVREFLQESAVTLVDAVRAAAGARLMHRRPRQTTQKPGSLALPGRVLSATGPGGASGRRPRLIAIGASTGGPEAILRILEALPADAPPVLLVQHMPEGFTAAFARRLDGACRITVKEAEDGDALLPGRALLAPGNRHLLLVRRGAGWAAGVQDGPLVCRHRPSADVLFQSVAREAGSAAAGVILTGMGSDGADGLLDMRRAGAATYAQNEESCVVFGMPKEAIARGAAGEVLPLADIPRALLRPLPVVPVAGSRRSGGRAGE